MLYFLIKNNPEKLLEESKKTANIEDLTKYAERLIELNGRIQLIELFQHLNKHNKMRYVQDKILDYFKKDFFNKPKLLYKTALISVNRTNDIEKLLYLFSVKNLMKAGSSSNLYEIYLKNRDPEISDYLFKEYISDSEKIKEFFYDLKIDKQDKAFQILLKECEYSFLLDFLKNTKLSEDIRKHYLDLLYDSVKESPGLLMQVYEVFPEKKILNQLINLKAETELIQLREKKLNQDILDALVSLYKEDKDKLTDLLQFSHQFNETEIFTNLIEITEGKDALLSLFKNAKPKDKKLILKQFIRNFEKLGSESIFWEILKDLFDSDFQSEILDSFIKTEKIDFLISNFRKINPKYYEKTMTFIFSKREPKDLTDKISPVLIFQYGVYLHKITDEEVIKVYRKITDFAVLLFIYLLEKDRQIDSKYLNLKKKCENRQKLEEIIKEEKSEKLNIFYHSFFAERMEKDLSKVFRFPLYSGKQIDLESVPVDFQVTDDIDNEYKKIESQLEEQLLSVTDPDKIMKAKALAQKTKEKYVLRNNLLYSLQNSDENLAGKEGVIKKFSRLINHEDKSLRGATFEFSAKSKNRMWHDYIISSFPIENDYAAKAAFFSLRNKYNSVNLSYYIRNLDKDYIPYLLIDQLLNLLINLNEEDIPNLWVIEQFTPGLDNNVQQFLHEITQALIELGGKRFGSISINKDNRPDSTDFYIKGK